MKNIIKKLRSFFFFFLFLYAIYHASLAYQYYSMKEKAENFEKNRSYSSIFQYNQKGGEPLFLVNPENKRTIFFMEGFRAQAPAGFYRDWFEELYQTGTNIIVPVYGLQSSPFELRNRDWRFQEDLRLANQVYEAYASAKSEEHEILLVAHSFGTLPALSIAVTAKRRPDGIILLSPLNTGMEFKAAGKLVYWF
ncbi:MAG: hypothetical protein KDK45_14260, partial [Leptospiraceae bacterium]|nr:hypothetical protein [Leptospiraceae bacterium]